MKENGAKYVRSVDFDKNIGKLNINVTKARKGSSIEEQMADQIAGHVRTKDGSNQIGQDSEELDGVTGNSPSGNSEEDLPPETPSVGKKKRTRSVPFIGRRTSVDRDADIIKMAEKRKIKQTFVTHDLG